jgi:hypothetical protein
MEELVLTDPVVVPPVTTPGATKNKYHVVGITMNMESQGPTGQPGFVHIMLKDDTGAMLTHYYEGPSAQQMIRTLNTANLQTKSMHKRILEKLANDGVLPGTVSGTPDPIA